MTPFLMNDLRARVDLCVSKIMHWALNIDEEGGVRSGGFSDLSKKRKITPSREVLKPSKAKTNLWNIESREKSCINSGTATHNNSRHVRRITALIWKLVALDLWIISHNRLLSLSAKFKPRASSHDSGKYGAYVHKQTAWAGLGFPSSSS